jgi:hypothetical protein
MSSNQNYQVIIEETQKLLNENTEWRKRYANYANLILKNYEFIKSSRKKFAMTPELGVYLTVSSVREKTTTFSAQLRCLGRRVALVNFSKGELTISTPKDFGGNLNSFGWNKQLSKEKWHSSKAKEFRSFFHNLKIDQAPDLLKKRKEARIESLLLSEFTKSTGKSLRNIQPIKIAGIRFPMPTPLKASDHSMVEYSGEDGGNIDIFVRTGRGKNAKLCVIELKDENKESESAGDALKQAIKYAVFIRELLRSDAGESWWKLFEFNRTGNNPIPDNLILYVACAMPNKPDADISFADDYNYNIRNDDHDDIIRLHYIYFDEDGNEIKNIYSSLPFGTPKESTL